MTSLAPIRWGILGTGNIAGQFAEGLRSLPDARLLAIGSRTKAGAEAFARSFAVPRAYASYEDLVADKDLDAVYVATPNHKHKENSLLALDAGKAVLCEKPFALDAQQTREVIAVARRKGLFCMEAMWMRFLPAITRLRGLLASGAIGDVRLMKADFGIPKPFAADGRFFNPEMGGGAMLNFGVYLVSFASLLLGKPFSIASQATLGPTGVDEQSVATLRYTGGALAILTVSLRSYLPCEALVIGTNGEIRIGHPLYRSERFSVASFGHRPSTSPARWCWARGLTHIALARRISSGVGRVVGRLSGRWGNKYVVPFEGNGFNYEAAEVGRCLRSGQLESTIMPLGETLNIMETMDAIRADLMAHQRPSAACDLGIGHEPAPCSLDGVSCK